MVSFSERGPACMLIRDNANTSGVIDERYDSPLEGLIVCTVGVARGVHIWVFSLRKCKVFAQVSAQLEHSRTCSML